MRASLTEYGSVIRIYYTSKLYYIETYRVLTVLLHYSPIITVLKNLYTLSKIIQCIKTCEGKYDTPRLKIWLKKKVKIAWKFLVWPCKETKIPRSANKGYPRVYGIKQPGVLFLPLNGPLTPLVSQTVHSFLLITLYSWVKHHDSEVLCSWTHHNNPSHHFNWKPLIFYPLCWQGFITVLTEENQKIMKTSMVADLQSFTANKVDVVNLYNVIKSYAPYLLQPLL